MITQADIIHRRLDAYDMRLVRRAASAWTRPGASSIRSTENRAETLSQDALTGMAGQYAAMKHLFGADAVPHFLRGQWRCGLYGSDQGHDLDACNIDFKASLIRSTVKPLIDYRLCVRPRELRRGWIYLLSLVTFPTEDAANVALIGWATTNMLPRTPESSGPLEGAHALPAKDLNPLPPFTWRYFVGGAAA